MQGHYLQSGSPLGMHFQQPRPSWTSVTMISKAPYPLLLAENLLPDLGQMQQQRP